MAGHVLGRAAGAVHVYFTYRAELLRSVRVAIFFARAAPSRLPELIDARRSTCPDGGCGGCVRRRLRRRLRRLPGESAELCKGLEDELGAEHAAPRRGPRFRVFRETAHAGTVSRSASIARMLFSYRQHPPLSEELPPAGCPFSALPDGRNGANRSSASPPARSGTVIVTRT
jgi:hypothetical protein